MIRLKNNKAKSEKWLGKKQKMFCFRRGGAKELRSILRKLRIASMKCRYIY